MKNDNILNGVDTVTIRGSTYEVRELRWKDYLRVVKEMTSTAFELFGGDGKVKVEELTLSKEKLITAIGKQEQLMEWLIEKATNIPKEGAVSISELSATEAMVLLDKIVALNLRPELIESGKALAGRMGGVFQVSAPSQPPSIASSSPATR